MFNCKGEKVLAFLSVRLRDKKSYFVRAELFSCSLNLFKFAMFS